MSSRHCSAHGSEYSVENLDWSNDHMLNICEESLKKILKGLVGVDVLELGEGGNAEANA